MVLSKFASTAGFIVDTVRVVDQARVMVSNINIIRDHPSRFFADETELIKVDLST